VTESDYADAGKVRHTTADCAIKEGRYELLPVEIRALLPKGSLAIAEVDVAYDWSADTARYLDGARPGPTEIGGRFDLLIVQDGKVTVVDFKGFEEVDDPEGNEQLLGYAICAARIVGVTELKLVVAYLQADDDGRLTLIRPLVVRMIDELDLAAYAQKVRRVVAKVELARDQAIPDVRESKQCKYCDATAHCPAKRGLIQLMAAGPDALAEALELKVPTTARQAGIAWERLVPVKNLLKRLETECKKFASHTPLPLSNGKELRKVLRRGHEKLDGDHARAVIAELHGDAIADAAVKHVTAKKWIEDALRQAAGVTNLTEAKESVFDEVRRRQGGAKYEDQREQFEECPAPPAPELRVVQGGSK
jgi:hypothetical protein